MAEQHSSTTFIGQVDFSGTGHAGLVLNSLTTTQRDALTPTNGMLIYNSTTTTVQKYENGVWVNTTPQDVSTSATPTFAGANLGSSNLSTVGNISMDKGANRDITIAGQAASGGVGKSFTLQAGQSETGVNNTGGGALQLKAGAGTGNSGAGIIQFFTATDTTSGSTTQTVSEKLRISSGTNGRLGLGNISPGVDGIDMNGAVARTVRSARHTTSNTAGNSATFQSGGATSGATDKASGDLILSTGLSTGVGRSKVRIQTNDIQPGVTTGTTDTTPTDRIIVASPKIITNNSTTTVLSCTIASDSVLSVIVRYSAEVVDTTNHVTQVETGQVLFTGTNDNGTFLMGTPAVTSLQTTTGGKTLAVTWTITGANPALIQLNINSNAAAIATGYPRYTMIVENLTQQTITVS